MNTPGWKSSCPNQERSRWSGPEPALLSPAEAREAGCAVGVKTAARAITASGILPVKYLNRISVRIGDRIVLVAVRDVLWIQCHGNLLQLHLITANYEHRMTIKDICKHLDPEHFVRVHRNAIVNLDYVVEFDLPRSGNAFVHLRNGKALPISRPARLALRRGLLSQSYASAVADDSYY
jgi:DNA-binding LytR/AlgR family response regulator